VGSVTSEFNLRDAWVFKSAAIARGPEKESLARKLAHITTLTAMLKISLPHFKLWAAPD